MNQLPSLSRPVTSLLDDHDQKGLLRFLTCGSVDESCFGAQCAIVARISTAACSFFLVLLALAELICNAPTMLCF